MSVLRKGTYKITGYERGDLERVRELIRSNGVDAEGKKLYSKIHIVSESIERSDFADGKAHGMKVRISKPGERTGRCKLFC